MGERMRPEDIARYMQDVLEAANAAARRKVEELKAQLEKAEKEKKS